MRSVCRKSVVRGSCRPTILSLLLVVTAFSLTAPPAQAIVRRRLNVNSNPPGALVYVDNQQIGTTPCSVDFTYYGTREVRLIKPGYETLTVNQPIPAPWYQYVPIDFVAENFIAMKIRDNRTVNYNLSPQLVVPPQELLSRADQLRQETLQYGAPTAGAPLPVGTPTALPPVLAPEPLPGIPAAPVGQPPVGPAVLPPMTPASGGAPVVPSRL